MKKNKFINIIRFIIQVISFILLPGLFIIIWNAIGSVYKILISGNITYNALKAPLITLISVIPITCLWGRFFCGYMCSFGSIQEFINYIAKKLNIKQIKINDEDHKYLLYVKYVILGLCLFLWTIKVNTLTNFSPWNVFGYYTQIKSWHNLSLFISIGGILLILIFIGSIFIERFFCKYLCPLGAIFSLISKFRIFKVKKDKNKCIKCSLCNNICPMNINVLEETTKYGYVKSSNCIDCFKCINKCPKTCLYTPSKEVISASIAPIAIAGLYYVGNITQDNFNFDNTLKYQENTNSYKDGLYSGTGQGYRGEIKVSVKVVDGNISSITVDSYKDDANFFNKAKNTIIEKIITSQKTDVDVVSGATYSSKGIIEAVSNALNIYYTNDLSPRKHQNKNSENRKKEYKNNKFSS